MWLFSKQQLQETCNYSSRVVSQKRFLHYCVMSELEVIVNYKTNEKDY